LKSDAKKDVTLLKTKITFKTTSVPIRSLSNGHAKSEKVVAIGRPIDLQNTIF